MRKNILVAVSLAFGVALLTGVVLAEDWPHWRGPAYDGVAKSPPLVDAFLASGPKKVWESEPLLMGLRDGGSGSVTVAEGRAYTFVHGRNSRDKSSRDFVYCLDADDGKTVWKRELGSWFMGWSASCTPTISEGKCYVLSSEAHLYCLDAKTGREIWKSEFVGVAGNRHNRSSSTLVLDGVALVCTAANAVGIDIETGKTLWRLKAGASEAISPIPWKSGDNTYAVVGGDGKFSAIEPKTGKIVWSVPEKPEGGSVTIVGNHMTIVTARQKGALVLYEMTGDKPRKMWSVPFTDGYASPTIYDGYVYVFGEGYSPPYRGRGLCIEIASGKVCWSTDVGKVQHSSAIVADGKLIGIHGNSLYLVKPTPDKYTELGTVGLLLSGWSSPTVVDGRAYLRTRKGVVCYDLRK